MHLILRFADGHRAEALLLAKTANTMRVVLHGLNETVEFRNQSGLWVGDDGMRVTIEAMIPAVAVQLAGDQPLARAANGSGRVD